MNRRTILLCFIIISVFSYSLFADYEDFYNELSETFSFFSDPNTGLTIFPTLLIPIGGKLEGMGTAYTAVSSDSGFIESNPAGSSMLAFSELSLLHHSWIADSNIEGIIYTFKIHDLGLGFGGKFLYLPFTAYNSWGESENSGFISESIGTFNISYNLFSSYYFDGIALGANVKVAYRNIPAEIYEDQSIAAIMLDLGILTRFDLLKFYSSRTKNFSIGMAVKNLGIPTVDEPLPMVFSSGLAYSFIRPVTIAVDFNLPFSFDPVDFPAEHWDIAAGINVVFAKFLSIQAGFRLKENPRASLGCSIDVNEYSLVTNYNLDLSGSLNPVDKFSIEAKIRLGYKEKLARERQVDEYFALGLEAYAVGNFTQAISYWEMALELDPKFLLALEYIDTTKKYLDLQQEMEEKQSEYE
ncbi:MAG: UPF0164 family protein [Spirochaetales bacterium]|nr:UPF0164 family protein [Spirochaetales bacterium]